LRTQALAEEAAKTARSVKVSQVSNLPEVNQDTTGQDRQNPLCKNADCIVILVFFV
jgi:hypothetical protein